MLDSSITGISKNGNSGAINETSNTGSFGNHSISNSESPVLGPRKRANSVSQIPLKNRGLSVSNGSPMKGNVDEKHSEKHLKEPPSLIQNNNDGNKNSNDDNSIIPSDNKSDSEPLKNNLSESNLQSPSRGVENSFKTPMPMHGEEVPEGIPANAGNVDLTEVEYGGMMYKFPKAMADRSEVSYKQAAEYISDGKNFYNMIMDGEENVLGNHDNAAKLVWYLEYIACCKNPNFMSHNRSNVRFPDIGAKIYEALNSVKGNYDRFDNYFGIPLFSKSSHYKKGADNIQKSQFGLDFDRAYGEQSIQIKNSGNNNMAHESQNPEYVKLPFGMKTILVARGNPDNVNDVEEGTYLKLEAEGINSGLVPLIKHFINLIKAIFLNVPEHCNFEEKIKIPKILLKYGDTVSGVVLSMTGSEMNKVTEEEWGAINKFLRKTLKESDKMSIDDLKLRLGKEMVLSEEDFSNVK